ncbi:MAG: hypothetical protein GY950_23360, partial [bacterium]|nr:hypothetical protein [bacterium]
MQKLREKLFKKIKTKPSLQLRYLRLAKKLATHGIKPPLTPPVETHETRWREQGTDTSQVDPETYAIHNDSVQKLFRDILPLLSPGARILEIGC